MDNKDWIEIAKIVAGIITAVLSAYFAVHFTIKKFYKEKWWEKKVDYYLKVINAVYNITESDTYRIRSLRVGEFGHNSDPGFTQLSKEDEVSLHETAEKSRQELQRLSHLAALVLSEDSSKLIQNYLHQERGLFEKWYHDELQDDDVFIKASSISSELLIGLIKDSKKILKSS